MKNKIMIFIFILFGVCLLEAGIILNFFSNCNNDIVCESCKPDIILDSKEIICSKNTNMNDYGYNVAYLDRIDYHINYDNTGEVFKYYYQYFLVYPDKFIYNKNKEEYMDLNNVEFQDDNLTIVYNYSLIPNDNATLDNSFWYKDLVSSLEKDNYKCVY